ncbi:MAG TPA: TonB-dependent receptor [Gemmatimonadaceae bacterium]|jgi:outer membrane receptor protein involved in Fe transport
MISLRAASSLALATALLGWSAPVLAQGNASARIVGRVIDATTGKGVTDAGVQVVGTSVGTQTGVDGRFNLTKVPAGAVSLEVRRLGYQRKTITGIQLIAGETIEQDVTLATAAARVAALVVTATAERGTVNEALDNQRTAVGVVNAVTAEQISRSPDADAAQAVQRVSGVTVQDNKSVAVRGLEDRYTTVALNGARVPSPEPEKRVVPLDLFPAALLQTVTTSKTFTPDQQGDFAGALVNIETREFPAERTIAAQFTGGYAANSSGARLITPRGVGGETFAMASSKRSLPALFRSVSSLLDLNRADQNLLINQFRDAWTPSQATAAPNSSGALSLGGSDALFGQRIGYLFSGSYSYSTDLKDNQLRALADRGNIAGETRPIDQFIGQTASQSVLWGGLANLSTMFGAGTRLSFNGMYNRTADNDARVERGHFENEGIDAKITRMDYVERAVHSAQISAEHQYGPHRLDWAFTSSGVRRDEPDRSEFVQVITHLPNGTEQLQWLNTGNEGAVRTFSALTESSNEGKGDYQLSFRAFGREHTIKIGGLGRQTDRDADTRAYSISAPGAGTNVVSLPPEQIFDGRFTNPNDSVLVLAPLAQGGSYAARDRLGAGYLMTTIELSNRVRLIGGARLENDQLTLDAFSTLGTPVEVKKNWSDVLPSLAFNYEITEGQQLRLSASRTLVRPEYRELAPITSRDVLNGDDVLGNDDLQRTRVTNADMRWEWYPSRGEVLSIGAFAKQFDAPIERVYQGSGSGTRVVFYTNAKSATNYGVELEARKRLSFILPALNRFEAFSNLTIMESQIHLGEDTRASATNTSRRMVGQAPYVINAGLTYLAFGNSLSATALFNRVGPRIQAAGDRPLPDVIEQPRNVLDLSVRLPVAGAFSARFDARNLLDAPYVVDQGTVTRERYRFGRTVQGGLIWRP